jgi:hypothetical protein
MTHSHTSHQEVIACTLSFGLCWQKPLTPQPQTHYEAEKVWSIESPCASPHRATSLNIRNFN